MSTDDKNDNDIVSLLFSVNNDSTLFYNLDNQLNTAATVPDVVDGLGVDVYNTLPHVQTPAQSTSQRGRVSTGRGR